MKTSKARSIRGLPGFKRVIIARRKNGKSAPIKLTLEDASAENIARIVEHIRAIEAVGA